MTKVDIAIVAAHLMGIGLGIAVILLAQRQPRWRRVKMSEVAGAWTAGIAAGEELERQRQLAAVQAIVERIKSNPVADHFLLVSGSCQCDDCLTARGEKRN